MKTLSFAILTSAMLLLFSCSNTESSRPGGAAGQATWSFDQDSAGAIPAGFAAAVGEWKVVEEAAAPSKSHVLAQLAESSGRKFNVILAEKTSYEDVDLSVELKAVAGKIDQGGGLVWRASDARNYYVARYNPLEDNYRVYKVVEGRRSQLQSADIRRSPGWHTLRVTMKGDLIQCYCDGTKYLEVTDATFPQAGKIGLWTKADAQSRFDDLKAGE